MSFISCKHIWVQMCELHGTEEPLVPPNLCSPWLATQRRSGIAHWKRLWRSFWDGNVSTSGGCFCGVVLSFYLSCHRVEVRDSSRCLATVDSSCAHGPPAEVLQLGLPWYILWLTARCLSLQFFIKPFHFLLGRARVFLLSPGGGTRGFPILIHDDAIDLLTIPEMTDIKEVLFYW